MLSAEEITRTEFDEVLERYPALIRNISSSVHAANKSRGQLSLEQLDNFRFDEAPSRYYKKETLEDPDADPMPLSHVDVVQLVNWKLKHGTFRPNLMKLAESNSEDEIRKSTEGAFETYKKDKFEVTKAINKLSVLKGVGPATASLILSVHDAASVVFFGDEVFQWICCDGKKTTIKYSVREYEDLVNRSRKLIDRIGVDARDVEKVGFVLMKEASLDIVKENGVAIPKAANEEAENETEGNPEAKPRGRPPKKAGDKAEPKGPEKPRGRPPKTAEEKATPKVIAKPKARTPKTIEEKPMVKPKGRPTKRPKISAEYRRPIVKAPLIYKEPTDMTAERKSQLQEIAARGRSVREAKEQERLAKAAAFRERIDAARAKRQGEPSTPAPATSAGTKRKSEVTNRGTAVSAKRSRRSGA